MRRMKELELTILVAEAICLGLLALCISLPMALILPEGSLRADLLWAFGVLIPVELIWMVCRRPLKLVPRLLLCIGITGLAVLIPNMPLRKIYYGICCIPILMSGVFLGRPKGKIILTVPQFYFPMAGLLVFALGKIGKIPLLCALAIAISVLLVMVFLLHRNQIRLQKTVYEDLDEYVSVQGIIVLNRKLMAAFLLIGILVILAVPWLFRHQEEQSSWKPEESAWGEGETVVETVPKEGNKIEPEGKAEPFNLSAIEDVTTVLVIFLVVTVLIIVGAALLNLLRGIERGGEKHGGIKEEGFVIERLSQPQKPKAAEEPTAGYEKKIRRKYGKRILHGAPERDWLHAMTPTELESAAGIPKSTERETVHALYLKARYSGEACTKEDYQSMKQSLNRLDHARAE